MKIQLIFLSFIVIGSIQLLPADGQRSKSGSVNIDFVKISFEVSINFYIHLVLFAYQTVQGIRMSITDTSFFPLSESI